MNLRSISLAGVLMCILSCAPDSARTNREPLSEAPTWSTVLEAWNHRAESIDALHAWGIAEIRWIDEEGASHMEQGDLDFWYEAPQRLAFRISKFGETISVYGIDKSAFAYWYNESDGEFVKILFTKPWTYSTGSTGPTQYFAIDIDEFLVVMGLEPLNIGNTPSPSVAWDREYGAWLLDLQGLDPAMSWWIAEGDTLPSRMRFTNTEETELIAWEDRSRARTLRLPGLPVGAWPKMPGSITVVHSGKNIETSRVLLVFEGFTVDVEDQPMDRVFDVDVMEAGLKPRSVRILEPLTSEHPKDSQE